MNKRDKRKIGRVPAKLGVSGGFRTGKRKRGNSLLKRTPRASAVTIKYELRDEYGNVLGRFDTLHGNLEQ